MYLLTNVGVENKNDESWLIKGYLSRWTIEEAFRWEKQAYSVWSLDPPSKSLKYLILFETLEKKS